MDGRLAPAWAREPGMLDDALRLTQYVEEMYARPKAPPTIETAFAQLHEEIAQATTGA